MKLKTWTSFIFVMLLGMTQYSNAVTLTFLTDTGLSYSITDEQVDKININTADVELLSSLPGIGLKKAQNIVDYRELNGLFLQPEEITNVKGIGESILLKIKDLISI